MESISPDGITDPLAGLIGYQLRRASNELMTDLAQRLDMLGARLAEACVLVLIEANPTITQSDIGRMLGIQRANMAPIAANLERRGLIAREPVDGRSHGLRTTPEGSALSQRAQMAMNEHDARIRALLPPTIRDDIAPALAALRG